MTNIESGKCIHPMYGMCVGDNVCINNYILYPNTGYIFYEIGPDVDKTILEIINKIDSVKYGDKKYDRIYYN